MQYNHKKWLDKIFNKTLVDRTQTRSWVSRFVKIYSKQSTYKNQHILVQEYVVSTLKNLRVTSLDYYSKYKEGLISLEKYQEQLRPLDKEIDKLELKIFSDYLQGNLAFEKSSLEHLR